VRGREIGAIPEGFSLHYNRERCSIERRDRVERLAIEKKGGGKIDEKGPLTSGLSECCPRRKEIEPFRPFLSG